MVSNTPSSHDPAELGELERGILSIVWRIGTVTAEQVREELDRPLKDSTVRTVLRRLEEKGYLAHTVEDRTFLLSPRTVAPARGRARREAHRRLVLRGLGGGAAGGHGRFQSAGSRRVAAAGGADRRGAKELRGREKGGEAMSQLLIETALRSLLVALVVWAGMQAFRMRNVLAEKAAWSGVLAAALLMPLLLPVAARWQVLPATAGIVLPANPMTLLEELRATLESRRAAARRPSQSAAPARACRFAARSSEPARCRTRSPMQQTSATRISSACSRLDVPDDARPLQNSLQPEAGRSPIGRFADRAGRVALPCGCPSRCLSQAFLRAGVRPSHLANRRARPDERE